MESIEEILAIKIDSLINYSLSLVVKPNIEINKVTDLSKEKIEEIKEKYQIEGVIIDVDDTLRKNLKDIPDCNKEWIENLRGQLKVCIVSNGMDKNLERYFKNIGIDYIQFALKPLRTNFLKACKSMEVEPEKVLVIGDRTIEDIFGGKINKMKTVLVKEVEGEER